MFAVIGDVVEKVAVTKGPDHSFGRVAADAFRTFVPVGDAALVIDEIHPIVQIVDQMLMETIVGKVILHLYLQNAKGAPDSERIILLNGPPLMGFKIGI